MPDIRAHTLIQCLTAIAQHHGLKIDPEQLINKYALTRKEPDSSLLLRIASDIGLSANIGVLSWKELLMQQGALPILALLTNGKGIVLVDVRTEGAGKVAALYPLEKNAKVYWLDRQPFCRRWHGEVVFIKPRSVASNQDKLIEAVGLQQQGRLDEAVQLFREVLIVEPNNPAALYSLAVIESNCGRYADAMHLIERSIAENPKFTQAFLARSIIASHLGQIDGAEISIRETLRLSPDEADASIQAELLREVSDDAAKTARTDIAAAIDQATTLAESGRHEEAKAVYRRFIVAGNAAFRHIAFFNLATLCNQLGQLAEAEAYFRQALHLDEQLFPAYLNLGAITEAQGRPDEAIAIWEATLDKPEIERPDQLDTKLKLLNNLGRLLESQHEYERAEAFLLRSLQAQINQQPVLHHWVFLRQKQCSWPVTHGVALSASEILDAASPLAMLGLSEDPAEQLASARRFVEEKVGKFDRMVDAHYRYGHERIRIGYLSSDLSMHAVSLLTVELFEQHDRSRFEVHAFCWSREDGTPFRQRVIRAFDHLHRIGGLDDAAAARLIRDNEIDILVDLQGLTAGARPDIVARGPAPIQIAWLGFPGTTALPYVDWVVGDDFVFPPELEVWFSERPLRLPTLFQVSDSQRPMSATPERAALGLPEGRFVYCAFNNTHKIRPEIFESWMRILRATGESVLWLLADNRWAQDNLRHAAMAHGIAPERLIFAGRVTPADYLGRFAAADLFLDTWPFNAGTTANDVLWAGLPLLTLSGRTYASRMAGSILNSLGLTDLITHCREDYERRAIELADQPQELGKLRAHLRTEKIAGRMFSTVRFAREFENSLIRLLDHPIHSSSRRTHAVEANPIRFDLEVEGWRHINHSYAIVNQFQLLECARQPDVRLTHRDSPFFMPHWGRDSNPAGFDPDDAAVIDALASPPQPAACVLRISSPARLQPCEHARLGVFLVTEMGIDPDDVGLTQRDIQNFEASCGLIITPSRWSQQRLLNHGFSESVVHVVPHAASIRYFNPLPAEARQLQRATMGLGKDEVVLLNVGAAIWNKGLDLLLHAFAIARQTRKDLRLLIKDQRHTYGIDGSQYIRATLQAAGLLNEDVTGAITLVPTNLDFHRLNALYNLADTYVSPYRAEGYNLPVREALACGTPVLVTSGGATDDFVAADVPGRIDSRLIEHAKQQDRPIDAYLEPNLDHLIDHLCRTEVKTQAVIEAVCARAAALPTWADACLRIREIFCA
jgi:predicted O-linked N-acetylglucosamine transferase (SPINDLY family)